MREGSLGCPGAAAAARPAGHALGAMDLVAGMEVGAEIEVTEDGTLEELPLHLENAKNCLSWESLDISSSDDDGEAYFTFCLPVRCPPRPVQRPPAQRPSALPSSCEKWIPPLYPCPLRPNRSASPGIPACGAYQCQRCLQVFMEEWHYAQHLQDHAREEEAQLQLARLPPPPHSPPRKLRCLECGKRFLRPEHFARHTKWHLKLVRKGIRVCHRKGSRRATQVSYVYKPLGAAESHSSAKEAPGRPGAQESPRQCRSLPAPRLPKASKRKALRQQRRRPAGGLQEDGLLGGSSPGNSVAVLDGDIGVNFLQPWQKQEAVLEGQVAGGLFQTAENQIIILDEEAGLVPAAPEHPLAELQAALFDGPGNTTLRPLFFSADEQAAALDAQVNLSSLQVAGVKDHAAVAPSWVGQNPCTLFRTVFLQAEEQTAALDGQAEPGPLQQVIIKASEVSPTLYLDPDPHLSSMDPASFQFVPVQQEPQFVTVPYGNSLAMDHTEPTGDGEKTWEVQTTTYQFPSYLPSLYQQSKQPPPAATAGLSPKSSMVVRLFPCSPGDHPEVLDLEYDTGGGIPVASEPWEANVRPEQESCSTEELIEDNLVVVEVDGSSDGQGLAVDLPQKGSGRQPSRRTIKPTDRSQARGFTCPDCGVRYGRMSQLRSHQKGPKRRGRRCLCECGASFHGLLHLLRHQLQHLEEALFICATCGKSLKGHRGLARHGTCQPGPTRFGCPCGVRFQRLSRYLWHHVRSQRPGLRVYTLAGFLSSA
ncbi:Gastrula zinc finger protein XlCGF48.2 [Varanus komodoensis]|uniref:myeloid zinc finger 1-like n=1 Tax=Varanus komodoensis TaxID=61221 RepID=UPI001CF7D25A|nr:myeloid zinc finger 1-like [Varanus komodoensis]KAF7236523.1 Gastrula zinc finger protein XlCGF48.2 [Varanus komodoensis]